jgi:hypothetical protein
MMRYSGVQIQVRELQLGPVTISEEKLWRREDGYVRKLVVRRDQTESVQVEEGFLVAPSWYRRPT